MITKKCECGTVFEYEPPVGYPDKRKYCATCQQIKKQQWDDKQIPVEKVGEMSAARAKGEFFKHEESLKKPEIKAPTGEYQSLVYNKTLSANSYEVGSAGNRFKIYFESVEDLQTKLEELKAAGWYINEFEPKELS